MFNKRKKRNVSSASAKLKNLSSSDRLSALPESIILHILSFLSTQGAARTSVLSKKWQYLWTEISEFDIYNYYKVNLEDVRVFVNWLSKTLGICSGIHLKKFTVYFYFYDEFASSVNGWVHFLIKNKVQNVSLHMKPFIGCSRYRLPELMYSNSYLKSLSLRECSVVPVGTVGWKSLTSLSIGDIDLGIMGVILSGCPVLEFLELDMTSCWGTSCLNLNTRSLKKLVLRIRAFDQSLNGIIAPYVQHLSVSGYVPIREDDDDDDTGFFLLTNFASLVKANLHFIYSRRGSRGDSDKFINDSKQLLERLGLIEELELTTWFFEVLAVLKMKGWKLPQYSCMRLTLTVFPTEETINGIPCLLESSPNIETLVVNWFIKSQQDTPAAFALFDLKCDLLQLKAVKFEYCGALPYLVDNPMSKMVELLLKRARILEVMVINVIKVGGPHGNINFAKEVLSYPRSSPKAVVRLYD